MDFVSLFSGAGGLDVGLEAAGWRCLYASDNDKQAVATIEMNRALPIGDGRKAFEGAFTECADVRGLDGRQLLAKAGALKGGVTLLAGGPPCQSWSSAGHQHGLADPRGRLFADYVRLAGEIDARWLLFENVRGLLTARGPDGVPGSALTHIREMLLRSGYQTAVSLLNAADFGVPQRRVRLFMFGFRSGDVPPLPRPTHAKKPDLAHPSRWVTLGECLRAAGPPADHEIIRPSGKLRDELLALRPGTGVRSPGKAEATRPGGHWGYKQGAFMADLDVPARTVTANSQQDWIRDPDLGVRKLCPRECAAIQTFPKGWRLDGSKIAQYRLVGNAVPPLLARMIGGAVMGAPRQANLGLAALRFDALLPLPDKLAHAVRYTIREENRNGASRRAAPAKRASRNEGRLAS